MYELVDEFEVYYKKTKEIVDINKWPWDELVSYFTLFKHSSFRCEEEYRFVYYNCDETLVKKNEEGKPYIEVPTDIKEHQLDLHLCEIKVGPMNKKSDNEVYSLFPKYVGLKCVDVIRSDIPIRGTANKMT